MLSSIEQKVIFYHFSHKNHSSTLFTQRCKLSQKLKSLLTKWLDVIQIIFHGHELLKTYKSSFQNPQKTFTSYVNRLSSSEIKVEKSNGNSSKQIRKLFRLLKTSQKTIIIKMLSNQTVASTTKIWHFMRFNSCHRDCGTKRMKVVLKKHRKQYKKSLKREIFCFKIDMKLIVENFEVFVCFTAEICDRNQKFLFTDDYTKKKKNKIRYF